MNGADDIGPSQAQQFVVAFHVAVKVFETRATVLLFGQLEALNHGAHGAIQNHEALLQGGGQGLGAGVGGECVHGRWIVRRNGRMHQRR